MENINNKEEMITPDFTTLFKKRGRPKMKPENRKPRKRKVKQQGKENEQVEPKDELQVMVKTLEGFKALTGTRLLYFHLLNRKLRSTAY